MKKLSLVCLSILMCGCVRIGDLLPKEQENEPKNKVVVCSDGKGKSFTMHTQVDTVTSLEQTFYMDLSSLGIPEDLSMEESSKRIKEVLDKKYEDVDGVSVSSETREGKVKVDLTIDFSEAKEEQLKEAGILNEGESLKDLQSLTYLQNRYENNGFACEQR